LVPPEQLVEVKLEDGMGWDKICPFLGVEVPEGPYPRSNDSVVFNERAKRVMRGNIVAFFKRMAVMTLGPSVLGGVVAWLWMGRRNPNVFGLLRRR
jgi:hypothetical protein